MKNLSPKRKTQLRIGLAVINIILEITIIIHAITQYRRDLQDDTNTTTEE